MTPDDILDYLRGSANDVCTCGQTIPDQAVYYAFPLAEDADAPFAYVNEWHDHCLGEWGWRRSDTEFGIAHVYCVEDDA